VVIFHLYQKGQATHLEWGRSWVRAAHLEWGRSWVRALLGKTKDYKIVYFCYSAEHATLSNKNKDWLVWNQDNVSEWSDVSACGLFDYQHYKPD
jgi:hypothetical protein